MGYRTEDGTIQVFTTGGYYLDKLERTEDGWRIQERAYDQQWMTGEPPVVPELSPDEVGH